MTPGLPIAAGKLNIMAEGASAKYIVKTIDYIGESNLSRKTPHNVEPIRP